MGAYAVIHTGGKQYRVSPGDEMTVEKLAAQPGDRIEINRVYLLALDGQIIAGNPVLKNTRVVAQVLDQNRGEKLVIFKHRRRKGYRKTTGHRQYVTELKILEIVHEGASYREQPEKQKQSQPAIAPKPPVAKKADVPKKRAAEKKKPGKQPASAAKPEKEMTAPPQPEKPKPVEQPIEQGAVPSPPAGLEGTPNEGPVLPSAPSLEPVKPLVPASSAPEAQPARMERAEQPAAGTSSDKRGLTWIIGSVIAALALLGLLLFIGNRPSPAPETRQETGSKPTPEKKIKAGPHVRDIKTKETAPVGKPASPAQPPD